MVERDDSTDINLPHISGTLYEGATEDESELDLTEERREKARALGRKTYRRKALVDGYIGAIQDGFTDASDARRRALLNKQERLEQQIRRAREIQKKARPRQTEKYRQRLSEVTSPTARNYAGGSPDTNPLGQRIQSMQSHLQSLQDGVSWELTANVSFQASDDTTDTYKTNEGLQRISTGLEELRYQANQDNEHSAKRIKALHSQTDYELIASAAKTTNVDIQRKPKEVTSRYNMPRKQPKNLLTQSTPSAKIGLAEQGRPFEYDHDEDTWQDAREEHFKQHILNDDEQKQYEQGGEWLPHHNAGEGIPGDAVYKLMDAFGYPDEHGN